MMLRLMATSTGLRVMPKRPDKKYFSKWVIPGVDENLYDVVGVDCQYNEYGLYLGEEVEASRINHHNVTLVYAKVLVGDTVYYWLKHLTEPFEIKE